MIPKYVHDFHDEFLADLDLRGMRVLEVGCGYAQLMGLVIQSQPQLAEIVGVNYPDISVEAPSPKARVHVMDAAAMSFEDSSFDLVYSLATFEHVHDFSKTLGEIYRVLKPGGQLIAKWSPLWNSFNGHHYGPTLSGPDHHEIELPWAHLIFDEQTLPGYLIAGEGFFASEASEACSMIYQSDWLNRMTVDDYTDAIDCSAFEVCKFERASCDLGGLLGLVTGKVDAGHVPEQRVSAFIKRTPECQMEHYKMSVILRK